MADSLEQAARKALEAMERAFDYPADHFDTPENEPYTMTVLGLNLHMVRDSIASLRSALHLEAGEAVEVDRDNDGELLIDWSPKQGRMLTMSLRADGRLS